VKPIDAKTIVTAAKETGILIVVEDHWPEGGLGDAVIEAFTAHESGKSSQMENNGSVSMPKIVKLAVKAMPGSGTPEELMDAAGITAKHIVKAVKSMTK
jgi:transketolase